MGKIGARQITVEERGGYKVRRRSRTHRSASHNIVSPSRRVHFTHGLVREVEGRRPTKNVSSLRQVGTY